MRHDEKYLRLVHKHHSYEKFVKLSQLPFFFFRVPKAWMHSKGFVNLQTVKDIVLGHGTHMADILPFPEFTFVIDEDPSLHHVLHGFDESGEEGVSMDDYFQTKDYPQQDRYARHQPSGVHHGFWRHKHVVVGQNKYQCEADHFYNRKLLDVYTVCESPIPELTDIYHKNEQDYISLVTTVLALFCYAEENQQRLVKVVDQPAVKDRKTARKSTNTKYGAKSHYIYLDGPPAHVVNQEADGEAKRSVRGHARKAHWRRLTHPKFKNHPKFGQRVRVRATWVGPTEWADQGKIYTLHDQDDL